MVCEASLPIFVTWPMNSLPGKASKRQTAFFTWGTSEIRLSGTWMVTSIFETSNSRTTGCLAWTVWIIVHVPGRHGAVERRLEHGVIQLVLGIVDGRLQGLDLGPLGFQVLRPRPFHADIEVLLGLLDLCGRAVPPRKAHVEFRLADRL